MLQEKSSQCKDDLDGFIVINNKEMSHAELCGILDKTIANTIDKIHS